MAHLRRRNKKILRMLEAPLGPIVLPNHQVIYEAVLKVCWLRGVGVRMNKPFPQVTPVCARRKKKKSTSSRDRPGT